MGVRDWRIGFIVLCSFFIIVRSSSVADTNNGEHVGEKKSSVSEMVKSLFPICISSPFISNYWGKVKTLLDQGIGYFSTPNIDFRKVDNAELSEDGMGEKVKEAVLKSTDKSKETMEDSAKRAAKVVGDTANKMKITSSMTRKNDQSEL